MANMAFNRWRNSATAFFRKNASVEIVVPELIGPPIRHLHKEQNPGPPIEREAAYVARGCRILGESSFAGSVRIDGEVQGAITAEDCVTIGETGLATTSVSIRAKTVIVAGTVRAAEVIALDKIEIQASGKVWGNLIAPNLKIEDGAFFEGFCLTRVPVPGTISGPQGLRWSLEDSRAAR